MACLPFPRFSAALLLLILMIGALYVITFFPPIYDPQSFQGGREYVTSWQRINPNPDPDLMTDCRIYVGDGMADYDGYASAGSFLSGCASALGE